MENFVFSAVPSIISIILYTCVLKQSHKIVFYTQITQDQKYLLSVLFKAKLLYLLIFLLNIRMSSDKNSFTIESIKHYKYKFLPNSLSLQI